MNIRAKLIAFQVFFIGVVLALSTVVYLAVARADYFIDRVRSTHTQLEAITALSLYANRYSEQIAEMLLFGEEGRAEFEEARRQLDASFAALFRATREETLLLYDTVEREQERDEFVVLDQMHSITEAMHALALELLELKVDGRQEEAYRRYHDEIEEGLDDDLQRLVDIAIADEREEVGRLDRRIASMARELTAIVVIVVLGGGAASIFAILLVRRALSRPIAGLVDGVAAIGRGELGHRLEIAGDDEFAVLSQHFNKMAAELEAQRRELLEQQSLLERKVSERTAQLEEANRRLKDLDRLRVLFLADVSHELRTPLTVLRGEAEVTLRSRGSRSGDYRETLERIVEQARQMGHLVDDLLFLTRAEADSIRFQLDPVCLQEVFDEALAEGRVLAGADGASLASVFPVQPLQVLGDRERLKQTALIAIDNAIKYSHSCAVVEVELCAEGDEAVARVRNHGDGIPSEDLPYVFDRFYRSRRDRANAPRGSGLGLSIAKWIVEKHGGAIALASQPNGVTELEIRLRRHSPEMV